jgi:hypothetical protein
MRPLPKSFLIIFLCSFSILVLFNWRTYFATPIHEHGDIAVNALQIDSAKQLSELYGNYSRFQFNHPGPAFFYCYALGEKLLCDWLPLGITPHNAHALVGLVLQLGFFALAVSIVASWVRSPLLVPVTVLLGAVHFSQPWGALFSIWPPHVLLMPFLAFWASAVSVACGRGQHLPFVLLAGSFLVHGHVAQPMLVLGVFSGSYSLLIWRCRQLGQLPVRTWPWLQFPKSHLLSLAILLVFLAPLAIDLSKGAESNIAGILRHLRDHTEEHKRLSKSAVYFLSFYGYETNQADLLRTLSWDSFSFLRTRAAAFGLWALFFATVAVSVLTKRATVTGESRTFLRSGTLMWAWTVSLCLIWGTLQTGEMLDFNGYFFHAVNFASAILGAIVIVHAIPNRFNRPATVVVLLVLTLTVGWNSYRLGKLNEDTSGMKLKRAIDLVVQADPKPDAPKLIIFEHKDWPEVASLALALKRAKITFYTDRNWEFMFQRRHTIPNTLLLNPDANLSVWRIVPRETAPAHSALLTDKLAVTFMAASLSPNSGLIDFSHRGNLEQYNMGGFVTPDGTFAWTGQPDTVLQFIPEHAEQDIELHIVAEPFVPEGKIELQPTELRFNGKLLFSAPFTGPGVLRVRIFKEEWNRQKVAHLHLHFPNATSPSQLGLSGDLRMLGLAVKSLTTTYSTTPRP